MQLSCLKVVLRSSNPKFLVVHVGANDLGNIKTEDLREKLIQAMTFISKDLPDTKIVWSQMLPRLNGDILKCRYSLLQG